MNQQVRLNEKSNQSTAAEQSQNGDHQISNRATSDSIISFNFPWLVGQRDWTERDLFDCASVAVGFYENQLLALAVESSTDAEVVIELLEMLEIRRSFVSHALETVNLDCVGLRLKARFDFSVVAHQLFFGVWNTRHLLAQLATQKNDPETVFLMAELLALIEQWFELRGLDTPEEDSALQANACTAYANVLRHRAQQTLESQRESKPRWRAKPAPRAA